MTQRKLRKFIKKEMLSVGGGDSHEEHLHITGTGAPASTYRKPQGLVQVISAA